MVKWLTSTDHKVVGYLRLITAFIYFIAAGALAMLIRAELFAPGLQIVKTSEQFNQLFTMHGTLMLLLFAAPLYVGLGNVMVPLQISSPDVAFPRLNMFPYWIFALVGLIVVAGFLTPKGASFGWLAYAPLSTASFTPGAGGDLWVMGLTLSGFGTILGSVNLITTILSMRAPGMTMPCATCTSPGGGRRCSASMIPGEPAGRWSGRPPAHRHGTTSTICRGSVRSGPLSTCTTRRPQQWIRSGWRVRSAKQAAAPGADHE